MPPTIGPSETYALVFEPKMSFVVASKIRLLVQVLFSPPLHPVLNNQGSVWPQIEAYIFFSSTFHNKSYRTCSPYSPLVVSDVSQNFTKKQNFTKCFSVNPLSNRGRTSPTSGRDGDTVRIPRAPPQMSRLQVNTCTAFIKKICKPIDRFIRRTSTFFFCPELPPCKTSDLTRPPAL